MSSTPVRRSSLIALLLSGLVACAALGSSAPPVPVAAAERAQLEAAVGRAAWAADVAALCLRGTATSLGREVPFEWVLLPDGRYRRELGGELPRFELFDGQRVVRSNLSGVVRQLGGQEQLQAPVLAALLSGAWLDPERFELGRRDGVAADGAATAAAAPVAFGMELTLVLSGTGVELELELDAPGGRPARLSDQGPAGRSVVELADWRSVAGAEVPYRVAVRGARGSLTSYRTESVEALAVLPAELFEVQLGPPDDHRFEPSLAPEVELQRSPSGHVFVRPRLDGHDLGWFLFDSGAGAMVIDRAVAEALELERLGELLAVGVAGHELSPLRRAARFELGPLSWSDPVLVEVDMRFASEQLGIPIAGVVGYDLFSRALVDLDAVAGRLALHDPAHYTAPPEADFTALVFHGRAPCVRARFPVPEGADDGQDPSASGVVEAWFRLDTGANGNLTFHSPTVVRHGLLKERELKPANFGGVGGASFGYFGRLAWFELGGQRVELPLVGFATSDEGALSDSFTAGNIGQELLEPFRILFDYSNDRIALLPSAGPAVPESADAVQR